MLNYIHRTSNALPPPFSTLLIILRINQTSLSVAHDRSIEIGNVHGILVGSSARGSQGVDHLSSLQNVQLIHVRPHVSLHVFNHATNVGDVSLGIGQTSGQLRLNIVSNLK